MDPNNVNPLLQQPPQPAAMPIPPQPMVQPTDVTPTDFRPSSSVLSSDELSSAQAIIKTISEAFSSRVVGQENLRTALIVSVITGGHILLESVPGLAKLRRYRRWLRVSMDRLSVSSVHQICCLVILSELRFTIIIRGNSELSSGRFMLISCCWMRLTARVRKLKVLCWKRCRRNRPALAVSVMIYRDRLWF